jgi:hypothetical protein
VVRALVAVFGGSFLTRDRVVRFLPFLLYLMILGLVYIANTYYAEKTIIESNEIRKELKELRYEYISTRSDLMHYSKQSEVAGKLKDAGIEESKVPPRKIVVNKEQESK